MNPNITNDDPSKTETDAPRQKRPASNDGHSQTKIVNPYKRTTRTQSAYSSPQHLLSPTRHNNNTSSNNNDFQHHIKQTFLGPICSACNQKIAGTNTLFDISRNRLKAHLTTNQCFTGNFASFKSRELENHCVHPSSNIIAQLKIITQEPNKPFLITFNLYPQQTNYHIVHVVVSLAINYSTSHVMSSPTQTLVPFPI